MALNASTCWKNDTFILFDYNAVITTLRLKQFLWNGNKKCN